MVIWRLFYERDRSCGGSCEGVLVREAVLARALILAAALAMEMGRWLLVVGRLFEEITREQAMGGCR